MEEEEDGKSRRRVRWAVLDGRTGRVLGEEEGSRVSCTEGSSMLCERGGGRGRGGEKGGGRRGCTAVGVPLWRLEEMIEGTVLVIGRVEGVRRVAGPRVPLVLIGIR